MRSNSSLSAASPSHGMRRGLFSFLSFGIAVLFLMAASASAATQTLAVGSTGDLSGSCTSTSPPASSCTTLRAAITQANLDTGGTIIFSSNVTGTITLTSALPAISEDLSIEGPGAGTLTISGNHAYQILDFTSSVDQISGLTLADGYGQNVDNSVYGGGTIAYDSYSGTLTVTNCSFTGNSSGSGYAGGAIATVFDDSSATVNVTNSTFSGNSADNVGGAILSSGKLAVSNSIFAGNSAPSGVPPGGGIGNYFGGTITSESNNLFYNNADGDASFTLSTTDVSANPMLAPLGNYGGPTQTMLLLPGSAAICAGSASDVPSGTTTDQRGFSRTTTYTINGSSKVCVDIGAVQTDYTSIQFTNAPTNGYSATAGQAASPAPIVSVTENGQNIGGIPVSLTFSGTGTASNTGPVDTVAGAGATFSDLTVSQAGNDTLSSTLNLFTPSGSTTPVSITAGSVA